jgi:hypothetical protein
VVRLERCLSSGQYGLIFQQTNPLIYSQIFVDKIAAFARQEIARSVECAYDSISVQDCARIHRLAEPQMVAFAREQQAHEVEWQLDGPTIRFIKQRGRRNQLDSKAKLELAVGIATDLERIV